MASTLSRRFCRLLSSTAWPKYPPPSSSSAAASFCTWNNIPPPESNDLHHEHDFNLSDTEFDPPPPPPGRPPAGTERLLKDGLDIGIYKAIIVGQVGMSPIQKRLKSGRNVTLVSIGTGGIRNNRRPLENEDPREYANRCDVQWHRVSIYPERLGDLAMKSLSPGSIVYIEGNLETKVFNDSITGLVRRIREIAIRRNGRMVFLGNGGDAPYRSAGELKSVGYY